MQNCPLVIDGLTAHSSGSLGAQTSVPLMGDARSHVSTHVPRTRLPLTSVCLHRIDLGRKDALVAPPVAQLITRSAGGT
ncbi:unnamed protein product [Dicrocoelium dendriticum]|nr:unnamed protein product [Dicrocoelium dendriticum]